MSKGELIAHAILKTMQNGHMIDDDWFEYWEITPDDLESFLEAGKRNFKEDAAHE